MFEGTIVVGQMIQGLCRKLGFEVATPSYLEGRELLACCDTEMIRKSRTDKQRLLPGSKKFKCYRCDKMYLSFLGVLFRVWD